ncbi:sensor histidine kinase [Alicyclobacillus fastidiosus]|uniref:histidine kinase n=1 Tax=Alicyclobacillus fastidiosus TaxID=392011 RepID=A0ABV5ABF5_9BACL|nr:HAMP domain-containing sensor histidine kinase [Alicyclobacillus fastidiosus]WEH10441.1 HAMP domain-containing sensor histidine kinase [Alicyclobacillus fastidiosus]
MFRRMYLTIASLLILSTGLLLAVLGGAVYRELETELTKDGQNDLVAQSGPVQDALGNLLSGVRFNPGDLRDERGQNVYFFAVANGRVVASLKRMPVPFNVVTGLSYKNEFATVRFAGSPYRVYEFVATVGNRRVHTYMYSLIEQEESMLWHARHLMWEVGGIGFVVALVGNLFLAARLMRPTVQAWTAYRETVLELSHELQTPLATVGAMMSSRNVDEQTATDVRHELERASTMVSDMLFLSRLRSGVFLQPTEPVAVSDITEEAAERYRAILLLQGCQLVGRAEPGLFVETTPPAWERLASTLFKNVVDHAAPQTKATWALYEDGRRVCFVIENVTIPKSQEGPKPAPERGVGLQIVARLAERMRGRMEVEERDGHFRVSVNVPSRRPLW